MREVSAAISKTHGPEMMKRLSDADMQSFGACVNSSSMPELMLRKREQR